MTDYTVSSVFRNAKGKRLFARDTYKGKADSARDALIRAHDEIAKLGAADVRADSVATTVKGGGEEISTVDYLDELGDGMSATGLLEEVSAAQLDRRRKGPGFAQGGLAKGGVDGTGVLDANYDKIERDAFVEALAEHTGPRPRLATPAEHGEAIKLDPTYSPGCSCNNCQKTLDAIRAKRRIEDQAGSGLIGGAAPGAADPFPAEASKDSGPGIPAQRHDPPSDKPDGRVDTSEQGSKARPVEGDRDHGPSKAQSYGTAAEAKADSSLARAHPWLTPGEHLLPIRKGDPMMQDIRTGEIKRWPMIPKVPQDYDLGHVKEFKIRLDNHKWDDNKKETKDE